MDAVLYSLEQPVTRCEARSAWRGTEYGFEPVRCHAVRGLREVDGHAYCPAPGHREQVIAQARRLVAR